MIGSSAFYSCTNLSAVYLLNYSKAALSSTNAFEGTAIASGNGYIYVPSSLLSTYIADSEWSNISSMLSAYSVSSSASSSIPFARRFTKAWLDDGTERAPTSAYDYYTIPGGTASDMNRGLAMTNLTYEILTNEAFPLSFYGWTHFMGDGPQLFISSAIPTDIDYLGTKIYEHPDNGLDVTSFYSTITIPSGNSGNYLTAHVWAEDYNENYYTVCNFSSVHELYSGVHYLVRL